MSGSWASAGANYLSYPAGDFAGSGAYSMAILVDPDNNNVRLMDWFASAVEQGTLLIDTGAVYGHDDFSSGYSSGISAATGWILIGLSKTSGSAHYRCHLWTYAADGSGTMSHGEASGAGNHPNQSAATTCRIGWSESTGSDGDIAVGAYWDRALSDAEFDTLKSSELSTWYDLAPDLGVHLGSWNGTAGDVVFSGSSGVATKTGTVSSGPNPSGFNFSLVPPLPTIPNLGSKRGWKSDDLRYPLVNHDLRSVLVPEGWFDKEMLVQGWFDDDFVQVPAGGAPSIEVEGWGVLI